MEKDIFAPSCSIKHELYLCFKQFYSIFNLFHVLFSGVKQLMTKKKYVIRRHQGPSAHFCCVYKLSKKIAYCLHRRPLCSKSYLCKCILAAIKFSWFDQSSVTQKYLLRCILQHSSSGFPFILLITTSQHPDVSKFYTDKQINCFEIKVNILILNCQTCMHYLCSSKSWWIDKFRRILKWNKIALFFFQLTAENICFMCEFASQKEELLCLLSRNFKSFVLYFLHT